MRHYWKWDATENGHKWNDGSEMRHNWIGDTTENETQLKRQK